MRDRQRENGTAIAQECLCEAQLLADSFERAIEAIAANAIEALEREVQEQTQRCGTLVGMSACDAYAGERRGIHAGFIETPEDRERTCRSLRVLTDRYEALLKHSGRTIRMLHALNQEAIANQKHAGQADEDSTKGLFWLA